MRNRQPGRDARPSFWVRRWLVHLRYALRGAVDGRRGLPLVSSEGAERTPTLHGLAAAVAQQADTLRARAGAEAAPERISLAGLVVEGGAQARAEARLATMQERLDEVLSRGVASGRRFGEDQLPDELVTVRRQREHERRVRKARKCVEDERTALSNLRQEQARIEASLHARLSDAEARARLLGDRQRAHATSYLNGALRSHPERPLLGALVPDLTVTMPSTAVVAPRGEGS